MLSIRMVVGFAEVIEGKYFLVAGLDMNQRLFRKRPTGAGRYHRADRAVAESKSDQRIALRFRRHGN